jgi:integrase
MARGRKSEGPHYYAAKGGWYVTHRGRQHCLAKGPDDDETRAKAERAFHQLMLVQKAAGDDATVYAILNAFLDEVKINRSEATYEAWRRRLADFNDAFGHLRVSDLRQHQVSDWLRSKQTETRQHPTRGKVRWGAGTVRMTIIAINAAFNWAAREKRISTNPIAGIQKPPPGRRERAMTQAEFEQLLRVASRAYHDYLIVLDQTGARPGEIAKATCADVDEKIGAIVLTDSKTSRKTGKRRVIFLTSRAMEIVSRRKLKYGSGPLFRNRHGKPLSTGTVAKRFETWRRKIGAEGISCYSLRHRFATRLLLKGCSAAKLAEMMGTSVQMIEYHYGHLAHHATELRNDLL